jgi:hypothetical protein
MAEVEITVGRDRKKVPVSAATQRDLEWWRDNAKRDDIKTAVTRELARRAGGGAPAPAQQNIQRAPAQQQSLELAGDNPASVNQWFLANSDRFNLISPSTAVQNLPEGFEIAITMIKLDPNPDNKDVYVPVGTQLLAPTGTSLAKISQAAGVVWDTANCSPVGDRSDPRYCEYKAVGGWRLFDGTFIPDCAHRAVDLRDGSDQIASMSDKQLAQARMNVVTLAETKAKNRVIRRLGLKPGYTAAELEKPFAVARLMWTGRTNDPALRQAFAMMKAQQMIASSAALFGPPAPQARHTIAHLLPPPQVAPFAHHAGSVGLPAFDDYDTELTSPEHAELTSGQASATSTPLPNERQASLPNTDPTATGGKY